jgi:methylene-tetrahydromethanopterin dehydrogenase
MSQPRILHMLVPGDNVSPFDVNMAGDAGYQIIVPYRGIGVDDVTGLIQDAIFSRPPKRYNVTGAFIGGWDVNAAADMLDQARKAMVPPFEIAVFADPNGAYTTSAALVALVERKLGSLQGLKVAIFGGGPVGLCAAVLIARQGGRPTLVRLTPQSAEKQAAVTRFTERYGIDLPSHEGQDDAGKAAALAGIEVAITTAKAGIQVLDRSLLAQAPKLRLAADVNAVPPSGIEGVEPTHDGVPLDGSQVLSLGALAIGKLKSAVQHGLFKRMQEADRAVCLDFPDAYALARELTD